MSDLRKAAEMALDAFHNIDHSNNDDVIKALRQALSQPDWAGLSVSQSLDLISEYEDRPLELLEAAESILREKNNVL